MMTDVPGCTTIASSAYRGTSVDGNVSLCTAAPMGARLTSMVGCDTPTGAMSRTVNGISKDSTRASLPAAPLKLYVTVALLSSNLRSEEHTSELQSRGHLVCRLLLEKKK